jgi:hypothetical protein
MSTQLNVKSIPDGSITRYKLENRLQEQLQEQFDNLKYFTESYNLIRSRVDSHETNLGKVNNTLTRLQKSEYYTFTYDELINVRGSFKPGAYYIITNFTTILTDSYRTNNNISSYRYNLQIILRAKNNSELYETGLLFFESGNLSDNILSEWKIWYSLDNDTNRFEWANPDNGRGVIYRMIDENGNDLPYDAINIRFNDKYTFNCERYENDGYVNYNCLLKNYHNFKVFNNVIKPYVVNGVQKLNKILF